MKTLRTFSFIISLCLAISANAYDVCIDGIYYNLIPKAKLAQVTKNDYGCYSGDIIIPEKITSEGVEYSVTAIDENAFSYCKSLTSIEIPNSITSIGNFAFQYSRTLTSIVIPNSVSSIGICLFRGCNSLASISIPNSVTSIGDNAFFECSSLTSIVIPNSVTSIGNDAFFDCSSLTSIVIPNSVISIGDYAFRGCKSLSSLEIPNSVTSIGGAAFAECSSLITIVIPNSVTSMGSAVFSGCSSLASFSIPNLVTSIGESTFNGCSTLASIEIPNSVTSIGDYAFYGCENLTNVTLGSSIKYISQKAISNCPKLENVYCYAVNVPSTASDAFDGSYTQYANLFVPAESVGSYRTAAPWSSFGNILALTPAESEDIDLVDGEEYTNRIEKSCNTLTYTRNFTNNDWSALYVPFSMSYDDWSADFEVARLNDVHQFDDDDDGIVDRTVLESIKLKVGSSTEPNTPYMIKAKTTGEKTITLTDATLYANEENRFDVSSWYTKFIFTGTYSTVTDMATAGHYAMANGGLMQANSDAATLGAFRWYMDVTDRNGNPISLEANKLFLSFDDGEVTEINAIPGDNDKNVSSYYTISGMNVGKDSSSLPKGLYIHNGKKYLIK